MFAGSVPVVRKTSDLIWQDAQHQVLFDILDAIGQAGSGNEVVLRLQHYAETHFSLEEHYMDVLGYPGREEHCRAHDRFRAEISELLGCDMQTDDAVRRLISTYLTEWLTRHVFGIDKELEHFVLSSPAK